MRVVGSVSGNMQALIDDQAGEISARLRAGIEAASASLLAELRAQVRAAGLGAGLEKAWRAEVYPRAKKRTFHPAALVYSKATVLHDAFDEGPEILPRRKGYLVVPTPAGRRLGLGKVSSARKGGAVPGGQQRGYADLAPFAERLGAEIVSAARHNRPPPAGPHPHPRRARIVLYPGKEGRLVAVLYPARGAGKPEAIAVLLPRVKLRKLLDIEGAAQRAEATLAAALD